jgi:hypothetical protein
MASSSNVLIEPYVSIETVAHPQIVVPETATI